MPPEAPEGEPTGTSTSGAGAALGSRITWRGGADTSGEAPPCAASRGLAPGRQCLLGSATPRRPALPCSSGPRNPVGGAGTGAGPVPPQRRGPHKARMLEGGGWRLGLGLGPRQPRSRRLRPSLPRRHPGTPCRRGPAVVPREERWWAQMVGGAEGGDFRGAWVHISWGLRSIVGPGLSSSWAQGSEVSPLRGKGKTAISAKPH